MKRKFNKNGFTLIELLAVIIILAILMTLAITAMSGYIRNARKDTFITTAQQYANAARLSFINGEYSASVGTGECLVVQTSGIALESGSTQSSFDNDFVATDSYIVIYNSGTGETQYDYYMQMRDSKDNGFGLIGENDVERADVIEGAEDSTFQTPAVDGNLTLESSTTCKVVAIEP